MHYTSAEHFLERAREAAATFQPLGDLVLIFQLPEPEREHSGLYIPPARNLSMALCRGEAMAVGPGDLLRKRSDGVHTFLKPDGSRYPMSVKVGDEVVYQHRAGHQVKIDGVPFLLMPEQQSVRAVIEKETKHEDDNRQGQERPEEQR